MKPYNNLFHCFNSDIDDVSLPEKFTYPFAYVPHKLAELAAKQVQDYLICQQDWVHDFGLEKRLDISNVGKMFGVLVVKNRSSEIGFLAAFSGKLANKTCLPYFVPPVYDLQNHGSFYIEGEQELNELNNTIKIKKNAKDYIEIKDKLQHAINTSEQELSQMRSDIKLSKKYRDNIRSKSKEELGAEGYDVLLEKLKNDSIKEQYDYKHRRKEWKLIIDKLNERIRVLDDEIERYKTLRKNKSAHLQEQLFQNYIFLNGKGEKSNAYDIFKSYSGTLPPAGTGECAAPKLLQYAFDNGMQPLCMAEFWWGQSPNSEVRRHKNMYPSCKSKCLPILGFMLKGIEHDDAPITPKLNTKIEILYSDDHIAIVVKPPEFLSVPGKTVSDSVYSRVKEIFPRIEEPVMVHRLDQSTSGLMVIAKTKEVHKNLQQQFTDRKVKKRYTAILDGVITEDKGFVKLPLRVDLDNRPQQMVCYKHGKMGVTRWERIKVVGNKTWVHFYPLTGRTHQLRVHAAHYLGLNSPILGDDLYGSKNKRLYLHADYIGFTHPYSGKYVDFNLDASFLSYEENCT